MNIQWYPGHMTKARRQLADKLKMIDLVIEMLDARAPRASLNPDFDDLFARKERLFLLNKADLADANATKSWIQYFAGQGKTAFPFSVTKGNVEEMKQAIARSVEPIVERYRQKGAKKTIRALVAGIPNVGKSALLNRLLGTKRLKEGNRPGVTKSLQWAKINSYLEIMDTPGLLWPKFEDERAGAALALIGSVKLDILNEEELAFYLVDMLQKTAPSMLAQRYGLEETDGDAWQVVCEISRKRGFLIKGGEFDTERGARTLLDEFKNGKLGRISLEKPGDERT